MSDHSETFLIFAESAPVVPAAIRQKLDNIPMNRRLSTFCNTFVKAPEIRHHGTGKGAVSARSALPAGNAGPGLLGQPPPTRSTGFPAALPVTTHRPRAGQPQSRQTTRSVIPALTWAASPEQLSRTGPGSFPDRPGPARKRCPGPWGGPY